MKLFTLSATLCFLAGAAAFASVPIEFTGLLTTSEKTLFALTGTESGASQWISIGQHFEGYEVLAYEADEQVLGLKKDGETFRVRLKDAKTREAAPRVWIKPKPGEPAIGLIALSRIELSVADKDGNIIYSGSLDPNEPRRVPRGGEVIITTETPEKLKVDVDGKQWPLQDSRSKTYLKTVIVQAPRDKVSKQKE